MKVEFIPLDFDSFEVNSRTYIRVIGRDDKGRRVAIIDDCEAYFWAILDRSINRHKEDDLKKKILGISIKEGSKSFNVKKVEVEVKRFLGRVVRAFRIVVNDFSAVKKISDKINFPGIIGVKENDLSFVTRYIISKKMIPCYWCEVEGEIIDNMKKFGGMDEKLRVDLCLKAEKIKKLDIQRDFCPKFIAFDIETDDFEIGKGSILMISIVSGKFKRVLTWKNVSCSSDEVVFFDSEKEMIEEFVKLFKEIDPDFLTGYFSDGFDLPYLKSRADKLKISLNIGIDGSSIKLSGGKNTRAKISGVVHIDLLRFIETAYSQYLKSETLSLNEVAYELIGERKKEFRYVPGMKMSNEDWKSFFEYNLHDSILAGKLFEKIFPDLIEFSRIMQEPMFNVSRDGMATNVDNYIIHNLDKYNEIIENKPDHDEISKRREREKYEGAFVLQPIPKLYENLVMFDFTSYWPSIIATFNLSRSTFLGDKKVNDSFEVEVADKKFYFSKEKGFFPEMLEEIINKRKQFKKELKENNSPLLRARSNAFKLLANASYGYQGFFGARYYCPEASAATTALSRKFIKEVIEAAKNEGFNPIYGDTDSICLEIKNKTKKQTLEFLDKINKQLPGIMELELEDFYLRGIWVTTRKGDFGAKKKYALINEEKKMKIRGFETVRRDWCNLARDLQNKVLERILIEGNEKSALEYTKEIIRRVLERRVNKKDILIKTQLKKSISDYKAETPHVTIAKKMIERGMPVDSGMIIEYYVAESVNKKALKRDRAVFPDEDKPYDIDYYIQKQIIPAVENIFMVFGIDIKSIIVKNSQRSLNDFSL
ncbi:MAG: DNA-directed DNA polymerase [Candidatus Pacearchaeota archaeon]